MYGLTSLPARKISYKFANRSFVDLLVLYSFYSVITQCIITSYFMIDFNEGQIELF